MVLIPYRDLLIFGLGVAFMFGLDVLSIAYLVAKGIKDKKNNG